MTLSPAQLDELETKLAAATQQPWSNDRPFPRVIDGAGSTDNMAVVHADQASDADLIVAAVNALPDLIVTVRRLQSELAAKQAVIDKVTELVERAEHDSAATLDHEDLRVYMAAVVLGNVAKKIRTALAGQEQT